MKVEERYKIVDQLLSRLYKQRFNKFIVVHAARFKSKEVTVWSNYIKLKTAVTFSGPHLEFLMPRFHLFIPEKTMYEISGDYQDRRELGNFINKVYDKRLLELIKHRRSI